MLLLITLVLPGVFYLCLLLLPPLGGSPEVIYPKVHFPLSKLPFTPGALGGQPAYPGQITNVQVVDLDRDGLADALACDARIGRVLWFRQVKRGEWEEIPLNADRELAAPAHATVMDLDQDGDLDVAVAVLGKVWPTDERIGAVAWLENQGEMKFTTHVLLDDLRRVADVQGGDFDRDGDIDLVAAVFGYDRGQILWLENKGQNRFRDHELMAVPGTIHVPVGDFDRDGDLDFVAVVSQEAEEVWAFENVGGAPVPFKARRLRFTYNFDLGSAGLVPCDLDRDGDSDFLLSAGDNLELLHNYPQPWHGCFWLENQGGWKFVSQRMANLGGTYAAAPGDLDGDGDLDVALVSMFNDWTQPGAASVVWLENDGRQNFTTWQIADSPIRLATVACSDLNDDGQADIVAGSFHLMSPFHRLGRVPVWISSQKGPR